MPGLGPTADGLGQDKNYLVTLTYNACGVRSAEEAAQLFSQFLVTNGDLVVNVREVPLDDNQDFEEVEVSLR